MNNNTKIDPFDPSADADGNDWRTHYTRAEQAELDRLDPESGGSKRQRLALFLAGLAAGTAIFGWGASKAVRQVPSSDWQYVNASNENAGVRYWDEQWRPVETHPEKLPGPNKAAIAALGATSGAALGAFGATGLKKRQEREYDTTRDRYDSRRGYREPSSPQKAFTELR